MKIVLKINWVLVTLLSIATGVFKVLEQEEDIELYKIVEMNENMVFALGVVQLIGGVLLIPAKTRILGAIIMISTFILATFAVYANELYTFGAISILFIVMAALVIYMQIAYRKKNVRA